MLSGNTCHDPEHFYKKMFIYIFCIVEYSFNYFTFTVECSNVCKNVCVIFGIDFRIVFENISFFILNNLKKKKNKTEEWNDLNTHNDSKRYTSSVE